MRELAILQNSFLTWPEKVGALAVMFKERGDVLCPVMHRFEPGLYVREMHVPKGTYFIGRAHRHGHKVTLDAGTVRLISERDEAVLHGGPGAELVTVPYYVMVFEAMTDVYGSTYHPNPSNSRNIDALEDDIFHPAEDILAIGREVLNRLSRIAA